jgi:hypothetical protein
VSHCYVALRSLTPTEVVRGAGEVMGAPFTKTFSLRKNKRGFGVSAYEHGFSREQEGSSCTATGLALEIEGRVIFQ